MSLRRWGRKEPSFDTRDAYSDGAEPTPSIFEYLQEHSGDLAQSHAMWVKITGRVRWIQDDPKLVDAFKREVPAVLENGGYSHSPASVERTTYDTIKPLSVLSLIAARYDADISSDLTISQQVMKPTEFFFSTLDPSVLGVIRARSFPTLQFMNNYANLMIDFMRADHISNQLLVSLCEQYLQSPDQISELLAAYNDDAESVEPLLAELRNIIATDWHHVDPEKSILRTKCEELSSDPSLSVEPFCRMVSEYDGKDPAYRAVKSMGSYAVMSSSLVARTGGSEAVRRHLQSTYDMWPQVPDLQGAFNHYVEETHASCVRVFDQMAGPRAPTDVRMHRSQEEVVRLAAGVKVYGTAPRAETRSHNRRLKTQTGASRLPSSDTLSASIEAIAEKPLMTTRRIGSSQQFEIIDGDPAEICSQFGIEPDSELGTDIQGLIAHLQQPGGSIAGVKRLQTATLNAGGKKSGLWRFAPNSAPGVTVKSSNRYHRIVYAVVDGALVIHDVLSHDAFDKKY